MDIIFLVNIFKLMMLRRFYLFFFQGLVIVEPAENLLFLDSEREFLTGSEVVIPLDIMSRSGHPVSRYRYLRIWIGT